MLPNFAMIVSLEDIRLMSKIGVEVPRIITKSEYYCSENLMDYNIHYDLLSKDVHLS